MFLLFKTTVVILIANGEPPLQWIKNLPWIKNSTIKIASVIADKDAWYVPFFNWDGQYYLVLADQGYAAAQNSQAFFPLLPLLMGLANYITGHLFIGTLLVNFIASWFFVVYFHRYARTFLPDHHALMSVVLVLSFPTAFFMAAAYSEALFLLCLFGFVYAYRAGDHGKCALFATLLPLARGQALFVGFAMAALLLWRLVRKERVLHRRDAAAFAGLAAGGAACLAFYYFQTGSLFTPFRVQSEFPADNSFQNLFNPLVFLGYLFSAPQDLFIANSWVNRVFVVLMLAGTFIVVRLKDRFTSLLYFSLAYFPVAMGASGLSYSRFALLAFPFLAVALLRAAPNRWMIYGLAGVMLSLQFYFAWRFSHFDWVA